MDDVLLRGQAGAHGPVDTGSGHGHRARPSLSAHGGGEGLLPSGVRCSGGGRNKPTSKRLFCPLEGREQNAAGGDMREAG